MVQKARPISAAAQASVNAVKVRRGDVRRAVIVRTRKLVRRPDGSFVRFDDNAAVLLNNKREMLGTRIGGIVSADLRLKGWGKIASLAPRVSSPQTNLSPSFRLQLSVLRLYDIVQFIFSYRVSLFQLRVHPELVRYATLRHHLVASSRLSFNAYVPSPYLEEQRVFGPCLQGIHEGMMRLCAFSEFCLRAYCDSIRL